MGHRQRRTQFSDAMVRQRRRNLGSDVDQIEGQRPGQGERGSWTLNRSICSVILNGGCRSEESLTTILHNCLGGYLWKEILRCAQNDGFRAPRPFGHSHMLLTGITKQIEAQSRARARRYETEYLANIFGLDWEPSSLTLCSEQGARQGARVRLRRIEYQVKNRSLSLSRERASAPGARG